MKALPFDGVKAVASEMGLRVPAGNQRKAVQIVEDALQQRKGSSDRSVPIKYDMDTPGGLAAAQKEMRGTPVAETPVTAIPPERGAGNGQGTSAQVGAQNGQQRLAAETGGTTSPAQAGPGAEPGQPVQPQSGRGVGQQVEQVFHDVQDMLIEGRTDLASQTLKDSGLSMRDYSAWRKSRDVRPPRTANDLLDETEPLSSSTPTSQPTRRPSPASTEPTAPPAAETPSSQPEGSGRQTDSLSPRPINVPQSNIDYRGPYRTVLDKIKSLFMGTDKNGSNFPAMRELVARGLRIESETAREIGAMLARSAKVEHDVRAPNLNPLSKGFWRRTPEHVEPLVEKYKSLENPNMEYSGLTLAMDADAQRSAGLSGPLKFADKKAQAYADQAIDNYHATGLMAESSGAMRNEIAICREV